MKSFLTIGLLVLSNAFMTMAWYGHLKFKEMAWFNKLGLFSIILISWGIALFEYCFQVPANRIGFKENGGAFSLVELKVIQEVITLVIFMVFTLIFFKTETFRWNHFVGFLFLVLAVYFIFRK
ncbi:DMT family protein [Dyadobacter fermentans]|uniref:DMT family protein n=1 Tax=Dyadobacter fermentans TaxID=94254 RepID=UPI001CBBC370|nr:DMT family protein [Dyadobacter fermentans]MBZ1357039.1 DMT family protein [Dyadobacter fermentans]